jgi:hypothetical protein
MTAQPLLRAIGVYAIIIYVTVPLIIYVFFPWAVPRGATPTPPALAELIGTKAQIAGNGNPAVARPPPAWSRFNQAQLMQSMQSIMAAQHVRLEAMRRLRSLRAPTPPPTLPPKEIPLGSRMLIAIPRYCQVSDIFIAPLL